MMTTLPKCIIALRMNLSLRFRSMRERLERLLIDLRRTILKNLVIRSLITRLRRILYRSFIVIGNKDRAVLAWRIMIIMVGSTVPNDLRLVHSLISKVITLICLMLMAPKQMMCARVYYLVLIMRPAINMISPWVKRV